jgi:hypothetical protein
MPPIFISRHGILVSLAALSYAARSLPMKRRRRLHLAGATTAATRRTVGIDIEGQGQISIVVAPASGSTHAPTVRQFSGGPEAAEQGRP